MYAFQNGEWSRHRLWRKKDPKSSVYGTWRWVTWTATGSTRSCSRTAIGGASGSDSARGRQFAEIEEAEEPPLDSPGQCIRLADVNGDGRTDLVVSKTITSANPNEKGGWSVYLNRGK